VGTTVFYPETVRLER